MIGGPLDGREDHAVSYKRRQELLFDGPRVEGELHVHVYESAGGGPYNYRGTRAFVPNKDTVRSLGL